MKDNKLKFIVNETTTLNEELKKKLSRRFYRHLKHEEAIILVNGETKKGFEMVNPSDVIEITLPVSKKELKWQEADKLPIIIYEDDNYLIVNKEAGLLTIPTKADPHSLYQQVALYLKNADIHILNRLDRETNGLVVVAKNRYAASLLQPTHKHIIRKYYCLVEGKVLQDETITNYIAKSSDSNKRYVTSSENGQLAISHYKVIRKDKNTTLLEFILDTGRTHQIRVHTSNMGHPIVGDDLYGTPGERLCLTSYYVEFINPFNKEKVKVEIGCEF